MKGGIILNDISKESRKVLKVLLKQYKIRSKQNSDKDGATYFQDSNEIRNTWFPAWEPERVEYACHELKQQGYLKFSVYDNIPMIINLTNKAIVASENTYINTFKTFIKPLWDIIKTVLSLLKP